MVKTVNGNFTYSHHWVVGRHASAEVRRYLDLFGLSPSARSRVSTSDNRQGRGLVLDAERAAEVLHLLKRDAAQAFDTYTHLIDDQALARELARIGLPLSAYTQWYWKVDLHNLLHFLSLRMDSHAQYEIRVFAEAIGQVVADWVPLAWEAFADYRLGGAFLSRQALEVVRRRLAGQAVTVEESGLSAREWRELQELLGAG